MLNWIRSHKILTLLAVVALIFIGLRMSQWAAERGARKDDAAAQQLKNQATAAEQRAQAAEDKANQLDIELKANTQEKERLADALATANRMLIERRAATKAARVDYDKVFAVPLAVDVDVRLLCAKLASNGFDDPKCPKPGR